MPHTSDHFDGRRFHNPTGPEPQPFTAVPRLMMERGAAWPAFIDEPPVTPPVRRDEAACVTLIGHSTFLIQTAAANILTDPMYSMRAGPSNLLGPRRVRRPAVPMVASPFMSADRFSHL